MCDNKKLKKKKKKTFFLNGVCMIILSCFLSLLDLLPTLMHKAYEKFALAFALHIITK